MSNFLFFEGILLYLTIVKYSLFPGDPRPGEQGGAAALGAQEGNNSISGHNPKQ